MKILFTSTALILSLLVCGQDLTGIWRGSFHDILTQRDPDGRRITIPGNQYKFEVQIAQKGNHFEGVTYSYLTTIFYGKATAQGTVNPKNGKVLLEELKLVEVRSAGGDACAMTLFMQYSKSGNEEFLEGSFTAMNTTDSTRCPGGKVFLRKVPVSDFYKEPIVAQREKELKEEKNRPVTKKPDNDVAKNSFIPPVKKSTNPPAGPAKKPPPKYNGATAKNSSKKPGLPKNNPATVKNIPIKPSLPKTIEDKNPEKPDSSIRIKKDLATAPVPKVLTSRDNELVKTIVTSDKDIQIRIYDNGTIDNDTVSVYLDKKLIISKQRLTDKPITYRFSMDDSNNYHELVMVAENLGEIPPNTSLMLVNAGDKEYEVRITSTEQKNAVIVFKYKKS